MAIGSLMDLYQCDALQLHLCMYWLSLNNLKRKVPFDSSFFPIWTAMWVGRELKTFEMTIENINSMIGTFDCKMLIVRKGKSQIFKGAKITKLDEEKPDGK